MRTEFIMLILVSLLCSSCTNSPETITENEQTVEFNKERIVLYEYKGVCITRIDDGTESHFYYGNYSDSTHLPGSYVKSTFSGLNSGMDAYLIFKPNGVEILYAMDYFENVGDIGNIKVVNNTTSNSYYYNLEDKVKGNYDNVCRVSDILTHEQELNTSNHSNVNIFYPTD